ncbi:MAG: hypothetical protein KGJ85_13465 [Betaproteobacteria bacterium]|nr:hypothetical protein [Betaproteobacteria bacterium]
MNDLFAQTKPMCFGRYAVELPAEAEQLMGLQAIDAGFTQVERTQFADSTRLLQAQWSKMRKEYRAPELLSQIVEGPVQGASYFWFIKSPVAKSFDAKWIDGAIPIGNKFYLYKGLAANKGLGATTGKLSPDEVLRRMTALMRGMRAWDGRSVPREPGVCIDGAFIHEPTNRFQEIMSSGFTFPSMPDVHFSVFSNKNASTEGDNGKGLLQRVDEARREQLFYPYSFLRRGKRTLHGLWDGEEVLARRGDGALQFDWELVGQRGNVARPSWMEIGLRTRVADNKVGAARTSAISEEQALELWDRLLEGVKFRVAVPGATAASVALA